jgi:hypothetical protein
MDQGGKRILRCAAIMVASLAAAFALVLGLRALEYSTSMIDEVEVADGAPGSDGRWRLGPLAWDMPAYQNAAALEPFRAFFRESCGEARGVAAGVCLSRTMRSKFPHGAPVHEFFDVNYDPAATLAEHLAGLPGHCVARSGLAAVALLASGIPARVIQMIDPEKSTSGHNLFEVWDEAGWVQIDPTYGVVLRVDGRPASTSAGRQAARSEWATFDGKPTRDHVSDSIARGAILLPDPWLYTRVGQTAARWPFRGAFVRVGAFGGWTFGGAQALLRAGILLALALAGAAACAGLLAWLERHSRRRRAPESTLGAKAAIE